MNLAGTENLCNFQFITLSLHLIN